MRFASRANARRPASASASAASRCELDRRGAVELGEQRGRAVEVEGADLEQLLAGPLLQPLGEARVMLGARRLGETRVRDLADQDVLELVRRLAADRRARLVEDELAQQQVVERAPRATRAPARGARARPPRRFGRSPRRAGAAPSPPARAGRCARRSAPAACPGSGRCRSAPSSASIRTVSSTKSGLPSVFASSCLPLGLGRACRRSAARRRAPRSRSGRAARARSRSRARGRRPSRDGCRAARAARARSRAAAPRAPRSPRCSISSSSGSSAQWMSSKTSTSGCSCASRCAHSRAAQAISCWLRSACTASSTPGGEPEQVGDGLVLAEGAQLLDRDVERVVVDDPGRALDHLGQRPVGDALAVGQAAAREHGRALERLAELAREPALADPGLAVDREEVRAAVAEGAVVGVLPAARARSRGPTSGACCACGREPLGRSSPARARPRSARSRPFSSTGPTSSTSTRPERQPVRGRADQELPGLGGLLEPRGDVDGLAGGEGRVAVVRDDLARLDPDPRLELELVARASRIASPARTARSASSSCACGMPKAAMTASPANFSTIPPCVITQCETRSKKVWTRRRTTSGSAPVTSAGRIHEVDEQDRGELAFHASSVETIREGPLPSAR